jgi:hypothetical protein
MLCHHFFSTLLLNILPGRSENMEELQLIGAHQLLDYADNANVLGENMDIIKKNTGALVEASGEVGLEVYRERTKCMLVSCHQNAVHIHSSLIANKSLKNVTEFKCWGMTITNQNCVHKETKSGLNLGSATIQFRIFCLLSSSLKT